jgi:predicted HTH domain antitoxin
MVIDIPDEIITPTRYTERDILLDLLGLMYQRRMLTLARVARLAKLTRIEFQQALAARQIPLNYSIEDLDMDLKHLSELNL